jgi:transcription antitermination factor NusG
VDSLAESNKRKWVVVGLSSAGERETNIKAISFAVRRILGRDLEVFVPAVSKQARDDSHTLFYMDGYIFVEHMDGVPYTKLQDTAYFSLVLCSKRAGRVEYSLVEDDVLDPLREGVKDLGVCKFLVNDRVRVIKGDFRNLHGNVRTVYDGGEVVQVDFSQRSKLLLIDFPVIYLQKVSDE